jgi:hypothetical protein
MTVTGTGSLTFCYGVWHKGLTNLFQERVMGRLLGLLVCMLPLLSVAEVVVPIDSVEYHVNIRMSPNAKSEIVGRLFQGDFATVVQSNPEWHEVEIAGGATGFISADWTILLDEWPAPVAEVESEPVAEEVAEPLEEKSEVPSDSCRESRAGNRNQNRSSRRRRFRAISRHHHKRNRDPFRGGASCR